MRVAILHFWICFGITFFLFSHLPTANAAEYEGYFTRLNTYPSDNEALYSEECQGVTTDGENWIFSKNQNMWLQKIPITLDLDDNVSHISCDHPDVSCKLLEEVPELNSYDHPTVVCDRWDPEFSDWQHVAVEFHGWQHVGDISYFQYVDGNSNTHAYIIAPFENTASALYNCRPLPAIGVFDAETLEFIDLFVMPEHIYGYLSWVAVDPDGLLYTGRGSKKPGYIYRYRVDWELLATSTPPQLIIEKDGEEFQLFNEDGSASGIGPSGGVFSNSGRLLYVSAGSGDDGRVEVFDIETHRQIRVIPLAHHELEGLTILDVDSLPPTKRPPNIAGQLHVIRLNNDLTRDDIYFDHFTNRIYVDQNSGSSGDGSPSNPFQSIGEANTNLWDGSQLVIEAGNYPEAVTINKRTRLNAINGAVIIGR